ncbi:MAG: type II toxin-antitoxin system VapC family toxin [Candidatus Promineifilaceae bacterium]
MALRRLTLDTSAYASILAANSQAVAAMQAADTLLIPAVVLGELLAAFEYGGRRAENRALLDAFLASPRVQVMPVTAETAERYATIYAHLRATGRPAPTNDLWIAASAMEHGSQLLTADAHFGHMPQIMLQMLPAGLAHY